MNRQGATGFLCGRNKVMQIRKITGPQSKVPDLLLGQRDQACDCPACAVHPPFSVSLGEQIENGRGVIDKQDPIAASVVYVTGGGAGVNVGTVASVCDGIDENQ